VHIVSSTLLFLQYLAACLCSILCDRATSDNRISVTSFLPTDRDDKNRTGASFRGAYPHVCIIHDSWWRIVLHIITRMMLLGDAPVFTSEVANGDEDAPIGEDGHPSWYKRGLVGDLGRGRSNGSLTTAQLNAAIRYVLAALVEEYPDLFPSLGSDPTGNLATFMTHAMRRMGQQVMDAAELSEVEKNRAAGRGVRSANRRGGSEVRPGGSGTCT
jgi:hypothetical protein